MRVQLQTKLVKEQAKKGADYAKDYASYYGKKGADIAKEQTRIAIEKGVTLKRDAVEMVKQRRKGEGVDQPEKPMEDPAPGTPNVRARPISIFEMEKQLDLRKPTKRVSLTEVTFNRL